MNEHSISFHYALNGNAAEVKEELELITGKTVFLKTTSPEQIDELLTLYYPVDHVDTRKQSAYYQGDADNFLSHLIIEAKKLGSSDIHIEVLEKKCRVRIRIDGMLVQRYSLEIKQYPSLVNKIKIIANLDIAEKRLPQDGRIYYEHERQKFDIRVSILPTLHGEKVVLRLLNHEHGEISIDSLITLWKTHVLVNFRRFRRFYFNIH